MGGRYQAYPEYKDSGVEWLGDIPVHWEISKLRYMFTFGKGLTITKEHLQDEGVPCVNYGEVHSKYGFEVDPSKHSLKCVSEEYVKSSSSALLLKGDLVFADTSEDIDGSGNFTQLRGEQQVFAGYHTIIARPVNRSASRFHAYLVDSQEFRAQIRNAVNGVKVFGVTQAMLRGANVWLPQEEEQLQIANFLDHETAKIDTLIEKQQQLIKLLKEKRQAVISHAVTKGLNPDAPMRDSGVEWLGEVPAHWFVVPLKYSCEVKDGTHDTPQYVDISGNSFPLITSTNFIGEDISFDDAKHISKEDHLEIIKRSNTEAGDVLMSMIGGNIGKALIVRTSKPFSIKNVALFKCGGNEILARYILFYLQSGLLDVQVSLMSRGGAQGFLSLGDIRNLMFFKMPQEECEEIVSNLSKRVVKFDYLITKAEAAIELIQERRTALISAAVTGKIDVRGWRSPDQENQEDAA